MRHILENVWIFLQKTSNLPWKPGSPISPLIPRIMDPLIYEKILKSHRI